MAAKQTQPVLLLALTAVLLGYFGVWLPGPGAGLTFLGFELGEWIKFMGVGTERNWFYLPPITLGLMLVAVTLPWANGRWQTWAVRFLGCALSLLAFPAYEDITGPLQTEYWPRVWAIGLVGAVMLATAVVGPKLHPKTAEKISYSLLFFYGILGVWLPSQLYAQIQPIVSQLFGVSVGIGWGILLNGVGHLLIAAISVKEIVGKSGQAQQK